MQGDKWPRLLGKSGAEPRLVAQAIAAFSVNNTIRVRAGLPALEEGVILGITMKGTPPTFYKIRVTAAFAYAVEEGQYPPQETVVYAHHPELPRPQQFNEGMKSLDNRRIILSCFNSSFSDSEPSNIPLLLHALHSFS